MVVGDDDQGIYRFRGASAKNVADFRRRFPEAAELRLEVNHRSTQPILDAAAAVVAPIPDRAAKRIVARRGAAGPPPRFWRAPDPDGQARAVVAGDRPAGRGRACRSRSRPSSCAPCGWRRGR